MRPIEPNGYEVRPFPRSRSILAPSLGGPLKARQSPAESQPNVGGAPCAAIFLAGRHEPGKPEQGCSGYEGQPFPRSRSILVRALGPHSRPDNPLQGTSRMWEGHRVPRLPYPQCTGSPCPSFLSHTKARNAQRRGSIPVQNARLAPGRRECPDHPRYRNPFSLVDHPFGPLKDDDLCD